MSLEKPPNKIHITHFLKLVKYTLIHWCFDQNFSVVQYPKLAERTWQTNIYIINKAVYVCSIEINACFHAKTVITDGPGEISRLLNA